jgi:hypothetical protein
MMPLEPSDQSTADANRVSVLSQARRFLHEMLDIHGDIVMRTSCAVKLQNDATLHRSSPT